MPHDAGQAGAQHLHQIHHHGHMVDFSKINLSALSEEDREHILRHQKHAGHEGMHALMLLILIVTIVVAQTALIAWKKHHYKSYQNVSMFGMWIIPLCISLYNHWIRFIGIWFVITLITLALIYRPLIQKGGFRSGTSIPRLLYRWFYYLYSVSSVVAVTGYMIIMATFLGLNLLFNLKPQTPLDVGFMLLFYGIYYGVLTRDFTDFLVDKLAASIGYYNPQSSLPSKQLNSTICAICGRSHAGLDDEDGLYSGSQDSLIAGGTSAAGAGSGLESSKERVFTLTCGHRYHEYCIYGWCLVGKKQVCPFCREKVDLNQLFASLPFQKPHYLYGNLLDFIRYLVAWQPVIILCVQGINYVLGLE